MDPLKLSSLFDRPGQTTGLLLSNWTIPFGSLQSEFISWKYKKSFPGQVLADRIKLWPSALAESLHQDFKSIDMDQVRAAAARHEKERQTILDQMRVLIIQKHVLLTMDPITKLELYEDMKYREFQHDMDNGYRNIRKFFPWLLPKRKYKPKKKSHAKIQKRHEKRKLAKELQKSKLTLSTSTPSSLDWTPDSLFTKWDPMQPKDVEPPTTYATSGCRSKDYPRVSK